MEDFWTTEQVANKLQVAEETILRYIRAGKIKGIKIARHWRITESDLQAYIDGLKAEREAEMKKA